MRLSARVVAGGIAAAYRRLDGAEAETEHMTETGAKKSTAGRLGIIDLEVDFTGRQVAGVGSKATVQPDLQMLGLEAQRNGQAAE